MCPALVPSADNQRTWTQHRPAAVATVVVLLVHAGILVNLAFNLCVTHDEYWHIPAGLWNATQGEFHYENLNPPLPRVLSAVPLIFAGAKTGKVEESADKETRADVFVQANHNRYSWLVSLSRIATIALSLVTGWVLADWALDLFGPGAAVLSAILWCFSPNVLANSSLVTSDAPAACAMLLVIRAAVQYAQSPCWRNGLRLGIWLGIAQLVKFTCLLACPMVAVIWLIVRIRNSAVDKQSVSETAMQWAGLLLLSLVTLNAGFLFSGTARPLNQYQFQSQSMVNIQQAIPWKSIPVLLPADYVEGIDHQRQVMEQTHPVYLDGEWSFQGFRRYFLCTWWYKTPHATQVLFTLALLALCWPRRTNRQLRLQMSLLLPVGFLLLVASLSHMQLGHRYLLPVFPFVFLLAAQVASLGVRRIGVPQAVACVAAIGLVATLRYHPYQLSYFNELSGGPENGRQHLVDSNLDWGQDLFELRRFVKTNNIDDLRLAYFGMINPVDLGIPFSLPRNDALRPGWHAISANFVQGAPHTIRHPDGKHDAVHYNTFGWFRLPGIEPVARIGYSMLVYNLTEAQVIYVTDVIQQVEEQGGFDQPAR